MKNMPKTICVFAIFSTISVFFAGCSRTDVAEEDARDRESPSMRRGMELEQVGNLDGAIHSYEETILNHPRLGIAHLHLAILLQEHRKDYIAAIYHYQQYNALRPDAEKQDMIKERIRISEQLLATQLRADTANGREQQRSLTENQRLNQRLSQIEGEKAALLDATNLLAQQIADLKTDNERLRRLVDRLQTSSSASDNSGSREHSLLPRLKELILSESATASPTTSTPAVETTTSTVPSMPATEITMPTLTTTTPATPVITTTSPAVATTPTPTATTPAAASHTYTVQAGDSLFRIAERVYGDAEQWKRIRDANKDHLGADGHTVHVGQVLAIP
jgi:nucleoid-associated protein YgaU